MTPTEIRTALTEVRDTTAVPGIDRVAFRRRVRDERRRRTAGRVLVAGAAVAVVVAGVALAGLGAGGERRVDTGPAGTPAATGQVRETVFFVLDGRLTALDPAGVVHDLDVDAEAVVGWTSERVYVVDRDSRLVVRTVSYDDEGSGRATFGTEPSPVTGPVEAVVLSGDGRYLGWTDRSDVAHRYDLKAGREDLRLSGLAGSSVVGVGDGGVLLRSADGLVVRDADSAVQVPASDEGSGASPQLAYGHVLVPDGDGTSRLYDLAVPEEPVAVMDGVGVLGPYAERVALRGETGLEVWDGGTVTPVSGLEAGPDQVRWADETTLLVSAHDDAGASLWVCDIELACARLPVAGEVGLD